MALTRRRFARIPGRDRDLPIRVRYSAVELRVVVVGSVVDPVVDDEERVDDEPLTFAAAAAADGLKV
jgi:hypothetical protein